MIVIIEADGTERVHPTDATRDLLIWPIATSFTAKKFGYRYYRFNGERYNKEARQKLRVYAYWYEWWPWTPKMETAYRHCAICNPDSDGMTTIYHNFVGSIDGPTEDDLKLIHRYEMIWSQQHTRPSL